MEPGNAIGPAEFGLECPNGGLIVVSSCTPTTTTQVNHLLTQNYNLEVFNLNVAAIISCAEVELDQLVSSIADEIRTAVRCAKGCLIITSRDLVSSKNEHHTNLEIGEKVSRTLVRIVREIEERPRFMIVKGSSTARDIAEAIGVKDYMVVGQAAPGLPVWKADETSLWPCLPLIVFPGDAGTPMTLRELADRWKAPERKPTFSKGR